MTVSHNLSYCHFIVIKSFEISISKWFWLFQVFHISIWILKSSCHFGVIQLNSDFSHQVFFPFWLVNESYKPEFIELKKWLKDRKFEDTNLIPACFPGKIWHSFRAQVMGEPGWFSQAGCILSGSTSSVVWQASCLVGVIFICTSPYSENEF